MEEHPNKDIEGKLHAFISLAVLLIENHRRFPVSAIASIMMSLHLSSSRIKRQVEEIKRYLNVYVFDPYHLDYEKYAEDLLNIKFRWENETFSLPVGEDEDVCVESVLENENEELTLIENEINDKICCARKFLLEYISDIYNSVSYNINETCRSLKGIKTDLNKLADEEYLGEKKVHLRKILLEDEQWDDFAKRCDEKCMEKIEAEGDTIQTCYGFKEWWTNEYAHLLLKDEFKKERTEEYILKHSESYKLMEYRGHIFYQEYKKKIQEMIDKKRNYAPDRFPTHLTSDRGLELQHFLVDEGYIAKDTDADSFLYLMGCPVAKPSKVKKISWVCPEEPKQTLRVLIEKAYEELLRNKTCKKADIENIVPFVFVDKGGMNIKLAKNKVKYSSYIDKIKNFFEKSSDIS